jgi:hypothetical protein
MNTQTKTIEAESTEKHKNIFAVELSNHIRFTILAVLIAAVLIVIAKEYIFKPSAEGQAISENMFEGFFISHLFFASLTPAALFSIYRRSFWIGITAAIVTSALTCTLSDIVFPYIGGLLLNYDMTFHVCIIEEPVTSWTFIITGAFIGYFLSQSVRKLSRYTHGAHILISSLAAGLYLITFGVSILSLKALLFVPILIFSVLVPCVTNDVGVPSFIVSVSSKSREKKEEMLEKIHEEHHGHSHDGHTHHHH